MSSRLVPFLILFLLHSTSVEAKDVGDEYLALRQQIGRGKYIDALGECKVLIRKYPNFAFFYETLPEVAAYAGRSSEAVEFFYERIEDGTQLPLVYYGLGTSYYLAKDYRGAVACFGYAIESGCVLADCYRAYEYAYEKLEGAEAAIAFFNGLCRKNTTNSNALYSLSLAYWSKQDFQRGLESIDAALRISSDNMRFLQARVALMTFLGNFRKCVDFTDSLRTRCWQENDFVGLAFLDSYVVLNLFQKDTYSKAKSLTQEILNIGSTYGFLRWKGWGHKRMADIHYFESNFKAALAEVETALCLIKTVGDIELEAATLNRKFELLDELGLLYDALDVAYVKYDVACKAVVPKDEALGLCDIAVALDDLGFTEAALDYAIASLNRAEGLGAGNIIRYKAHNVLGTIYEGLGQNEDALSNFSHALQLLPKDNFSYRAGVMLRCRMGKALIAQGENAKAKTILERQQRICSQNGFEREESYATAYLGLLALQQGSLSRAKRLLRSAFDNGMHLGQLSTIAVSARGLSRLAEEYGNTVIALHWQEKVLSVEEAMGMRRDPFSSINVMNIDLASDYENCIRLNVKLGRHVEAFKWAEKRQSHSLNTILATPTLRSETLASQDSRDRLLSLRSEILHLHNDMSADDRQMKFGARHGNYLAKITEINRLEMQYQMLVSSQNLFVRQLVDSSSTLKDLRSQLWTEKSSLVNVTVGRRDLFEFILTPDTLCCISFPLSSDSVEKLVESASIILGRSRQGRSLANPLLANFNHEALLGLYNLLVQPCRQIVDRWPGIVFVTDDVLKNLPFEILPTGRSLVSEQGKFVRNEFLIDRFEISYSLSTGDLLPSDTVSNDDLRPLLCIGNPISTLDKPFNLPASIRDQRQSLEWIARRSHPGILKEVRYIEDLFGEAVDVLTGSEGNASTFLGRASQYRILHVAAHINTDEIHPLGSGFCLSNGASDTSLTAVTVADILGLHLNCELAVMSGCNSGRTESNAAGGSISAAILKAGSKSVVSSLWAVDDSQTADFMKRFYSFLRNGERKVAALRKAKISLLEGSGKDPFYWGAFVLIGNRSAVSLKNEGNQNHPGTMPMLLISMLILISIMVSDNFLESSSRIKRHIQ
jgi:CHAT domain-containing protein/tetratricopeptide (TPR) repeat protein